jgi:predicted amidohydrolase
MDKFVPLLVSHVHELVRRAKDEVPEIERPIWLAAHLFAACSYLCETRRVPRLEGRGEQGDPEGFAAAVRRLQALAPGSDMDVVREHLLTALLDIDREYTEPRKRAGFPAITKLIPFPEDPRTQRTIQGEVQHWVRPVSEWTLLRRLREGAASSSLPPRPPPAPAERLQRLGMLWETQVLPPYTRPVSSGSTAALSSLVGASLRSEPPKPFKIALFPLPASFRPQFQILRHRDEFTATGTIHPHGAWMDDIAAALAAARRADVRIVLFPELCINEPAREAIAAWLRERYDHGLLGVVAGSTHITGEQGVRNEAPILGFEGSVVWHHDKRGRFRIPKAALCNAGHLFPDLPSPLPEVVHEGIEAGNDLYFVDTAVGRIAVVICADAIEPGGFDAAIARACPDFVFVVSMSNETRRFRDKANELEQRGIASLFVNAGCVCEGKDEDLAFAYLSLLRTKGAPQTRVRWRNRGKDAGTELVWFDFHLKDWRPADESNVPLAAELLPLSMPDESWNFETKQWVPRGDEPGPTPAHMCGMVVDLAPHWTDKVAPTEGLTSAASSSISTKRK